MATSEVIDSTLVSVSVLGLDFVNFNIFFRDDFLALTMVWPDDKYHISLLSYIGGRVTLKGFCMDSSPAVPFPSLLLLERATCFGKTVIFS